MFTYSGDPSASNLDKVRFLISDTDSTDYELEDSEVQFLIDSFSNAYDAAIAAAEIIAGRYAIKSNYSRSIGDLSISESFGTSAAEFRELANTLMRQRDDLFPPSIKVNAQAIIATANKQVQTYKSDFYTGMHDYTV